MAVACAIALLPSAVLGPVLMPPWFLHLPLVRALAWQGLPVLLAYASHLIFCLITISFDAALVWAGIEEPHQLKGRIKLG